ncbi:hypothetical protein D3C86_1208580 [compost metagenome]
MEDLAVLVLAARRQGRVAVARVHLQGPRGGLRGRRVRRRARAAAAEDRAGRSRFRDGVGLAVAQRAGVEAVLELGGEGDGRGVAVRDERREGLLAHADGARGPAEVPLPLVVDGLNAGHLQVVVLLVEGRGRGVGTHQEDGGVPVGLAARAARDGGLEAVALGVLAEGQGEGGEGEGSAEFARDRVLGLAHLVGDLGGAQLAEVGVAVAVVRELAPGRLQVLQLVAGLVRDLEGVGQHEEGRGAPEVRVLGVEGVHDAHGALGIDHGLALGVAADLAARVVQELELLGGRVIEGQDDGLPAGGHVELAVRQVLGVDRDVTVGVEPLEVLAEVVVGAGPAVFLGTEAVVLEDRDTAEFVGGKGRGRMGLLASKGQRSERQRGGHEARQPEMLVHGHFLLLRGSGVRSITRYHTPPQGVRTASLAE